MANLGYRLKRLEHVVRPDQMCAVCGFPQKRAAKVIVMRHNRPPVKCRACGRELDEKGLPMDGHCKCIILRPQDAGSEPDIIEDANGEPS